MTCKHDHAAPGMLPAFLCRACNPRTVATVRPAPESPATDGDKLSRYNKKKRRRLRAELRAARDHEEALRNNPHAGKALIADAADRTVRIFRELSEIE